MGGALRRLPGFRSGTRWKQVLAIVGYGALLPVIMWQLASGHFAAGFVWLEVLGAAWLAANAWGVQSRIPVVNSPKRLVSLAGGAGLTLVALMTMLATAGAAVTTRTRAASEASDSALTRPIAQAATSAPTLLPTQWPTVAPTSAPAQAATPIPTLAPATAPTQAPTRAPTTAPSPVATVAPTTVQTSRTTPEQQLASLQQNRALATNDPLVGQFKQQLDQVGAKCQSDHQLVADQTIRAQHILAENKVNEQLLSILRNVNISIPDGMKVSCADQFAMYIFLRLQQ